jgi:glucose-1-phosphate adenylyltransferase
MTIACIQVPLQDACSFGVMQVDAGGRVVHFDEKPAAPASMPDHPDRALVSMGIYVFDAEFLYAELLRDADDPASRRDFGRDLIPHLIAHGAVVRAHDYLRSCVNMSKGVPYWRDVGTIDAYYAANLALIQFEPELDLYDEGWPIWTHQEQLPPAKIVGSGCVVSGATVRRSLLFSKVHVHSHSLVEDSVILPNVEVASHVTLKRAVVDKHCRLPEGLTVGLDHAEDSRHFRVTDGGVTLIIPEMLGQQIHHLR